jgi:hypothetical protein
MAASLVRLEAASLGLLGRTGLSDFPERRSGNGACCPISCGTPDAGRWATQQRRPSEQCLLPGSSRSLGGLAVPQTGREGRRRQSGRQRGIAASVATEEELVIEPIQRIAGTVKLPGSKSLSNRLLLMAALAQVSRKQTQRQSMKAGAGRTCLRDYHLLHRTHLLKCLLEEDRI